MFLEPPKITTEIVNFKPLSPKNFRKKLAGWLGETPLCCLELTVPTSKNILFPSWLAGEERRFAALLQGTGRSCFSAGQSGQTWKCGAS